jgi:hypothetical protein
LEYWVAFPLRLCAFAGDYSEFGCGSALTTQLIIHQAASGPDLSQKGKRVKADFTYLENRFNSARLITATLIWRLVFFF